MSSEPELNPDHGATEAESVQLPPPDQLQRLHPSSILFELVSHGRQFLVPAIFAFLGATQGNWFWGVLALGSFGISILVTVFKYFTLRYGIRNGELIVTQGLLFRNERIVPTGRIQNMDLVQNVLHRMFGVAEVKIETASGQDAEAVLRVLTKSQIESLRKQIFSSRRAPVQSPTGIPSVDGVENQAAEIDEHAHEPEAVSILKIPVSWLAAAGLASNRGWLLVGIVVGAIFQFDLFENWNKKAVRDFARNMIPNLPQDLPGYATYILLGLAFIVFLKLLGMAWFLMRFYGYRIERVGDDLRVTGGLLTSYSATIPRKRIQFISIHRSLVMRWMGLATIRIETAGGAAAGGEESQAMVARRWFVPVVPIGQVSRLIGELRPGLIWDESLVEWKAVSKRTRARMTRTVIIASVIASGVGLIFLRPWGGLAGLLILLPGIWLAIRTSRSMKYSRTSFGLAYRSGILLKQLSFTFFERLQSIQLEQSPFDRRWGMATLSVDTAAAGPAGHVINVPYLDEEFAREEFRLLQQAAASHRPTWN